MRSRFQKIDSILCQYQALWNIEPFHLSQYNPFSFLEDYPHLSSWLSVLSPEKIDQYKNNTRQLVSEIEPVFPQVKIFSTLTKIDCVNQSAMELPQRLDTGIPGRKLEQIKAMGAYALSHQQGNEWLEWCSGKGYLGRILASQSNKAVISFEWQQQLCIDGQEEAQKKGLRMHFVQGDALEESAEELLKEDQHAVALHACGDLHTKLIQYAIRKNTQALTISPCCYHLTEHEEYQPLSILAKQSQLKLTKPMLKIPLQETVTGGARVHRYRQQEMSFRLGLDSMLRAKLGNERYISIPSIKKSELSNGFVHFCEWAADKKQFELPDVDFQYWQSVGEQRFWDMERINIVQQLFRRLLEMWLVLDRALFLEEKSYQVSLQEFCRKSITPRNLLIHAQKRELF